MTDASPTSKTSFAEWVVVALVVASLAWTTYGLGGYAAETMAVTCVLLAMAFAIVTLAPAMRGEQRAGWWTLPFLAYGAANVCWVAPMPWRGWQDWATWAHMGAAFWIVLNGVRSRAGRLTLLAAVGGIALATIVAACYQRFLAPEWLPLGRRQVDQFFGRASGPFGSPNTLAGMLVLLIPPTAAVALRRSASAYERVIFGWLTLLFVAVLALTISRGGWLALTLALMIWPAWRAGWRRRRRGAWGALILIVAMVGVGWGLMRVSPLAKQRVASFATEGGERSRRVLWRGAWEIFKAHPWVGSGAGSYGVMFERHRSENEQKLPQWAHNDYLNTLSDYGAIGLGLLVVAVGGVVWQTRRGRAQLDGEAVQRVQRRHRWDVLESSLVRQGIAIGLAAFALHTFVDFHLKIPALAMFAATLGGLLTRVPATSAREGRTEAEALPASRRWLGARIAIAGAVVAGVVTVGVPFYRAEALRFAERERLDALARRPVDPETMLKAAERARAVFGEALRIDPRNGDAWADRAYALSIIGHYQVAEQQALGRLAAADARQALALSSAVPEFWARLGVALDMQGEWLAAGDAFVEGLNRAPLSAPLWFYQAYHLSLNRVTIPLARAAIATCLRLDPGNHQAETLRRRLPPAK